MPGVDNDLRRLQRNPLVDRNDTRSRRFDCRTEPLIRRVFTQVWAAFDAFFLGRNRELPGGDGRYKQGFRGLAFAYRNQRFVGQLDLAADQPKQCVRIEDYPDQTLSVSGWPPRA